jgi:hypothetical protein
MEATWGRVASYILSTLLQGLAINRVNMLHHKNIVLEHLPFFNCTVEVSETRGTTALVYCLINSSLYTGTVHVLSSVAEVHPTGLTADKGCRQVSTVHRLYIYVLYHVHIYYFRENKSPQCSTACIDP